MNAPSGIAGVIAEIRADVGGCRICPSLAPHRKLPPDSFGTTRTGYVIVSEAAGFGVRPLDGAAGAVLRGALLDVGDETYRDLEDLFFLTQAAQCVPMRKDNPARTRTPTKTECRKCSAYLGFELRALRPRLVLAFGARAVEAVLGRQAKLAEDHATRHLLGELQVLTLLSPSPGNRSALKTRGMTLENYSRWLTGLFGALIDDL